MDNLIKTSMSVLALAIALVSGNAVAQQVPPEQVEETIDEVLDPEFDPSKPQDDATESLDTDQVDPGPPTDDRIANDRIESLIQDDANADIDDELADEEAVDE